MSKPSNTTKTQVINVKNRKIDFGKDRYILLEIYGLNIGLRRDIEKENLIIGRSSDSDIVLDDAGVSRKHFHIKRINHEFFAEDMKSTNGTWVNDNKIYGAVKLVNGDKIKVGNTIFKFICSDDLEAEYYDQLYQYSIRDGLTGLYNKKTLLENIEKEFVRCKRYNRTMSVMMLDIDFFKKVNDQFGHLVGDRVLTIVSEILKKYFRKADLISRFGGEEFAVVLPETKSESALITAERIRMAVANISFQDNNSTVKVTISIGVAEFEDTMKSHMELIKKADDLLYRAKENGRNRVES